MKAQYCMAAVMHFHKILILGTRVVSVAKNYPGALGGPTRETQQNMD